MKEIGKLILVLTLICTTAALVLSQVHRVTEGPIAEQRRNELRRAITEVLPDHDNQPDELTYVGEGSDGREGRVFYIASREGRYAGAAFPVVTRRGYSGEILALVGVDAAGEVYGVRILTHAETPGLGSHITDPEFLETLVFRDDARRERRTLANTDWRVVKDGGEIDQITGATISPRALVEAIAEGLVDYRDQAEAIAGRAGTGRSAGAGEEG